MKGADVIMSQIVQYNDWLEEEVTLSEFSSLIICCFSSVATWVGKAYEL